MKPPRVRSRSTAPLSLAPSLGDAVTAEVTAARAALERSVANSAALEAAMDDPNFGAPPSALSPLDRALLHAAQLQLQVDDMLLEKHARAHNEVVEERKGHAAALEALGADLRVRYALGDADLVNPETGAITRR